MAVCGGVAGALAALVALAPGASAQAEGARAGLNVLPRSAAGMVYTIGLQTVVPGGLDFPVDIADPGDGSGRLFVAERAGRIRVVSGTTLLPAPFLDISALVQSGQSEQGLLGLAFDPDYANTGAFYVNYTTSAPGFDGDTVIARYETGDPAASTATVLTVTHLMTIAQPAANHNGGQLRFGPLDGYLYISTGDGGGGGDSTGPPGLGNGQYLGTLLGKLLRVHVRGVPTYTIPPANPFTQTAGARPEIWAYGLRNPWRFSFDRATGDAYIGDVGQNCWEEIDFQPAGSAGGENYGWRLAEGYHLFNRFAPSQCAAMLPSDLVTLTSPITAYGRALGAAVTGGFVYRGAEYPWLQGVYLYGDYGSGRMWALSRDGQGIWTGVEALSGVSGLSAFGEDQAGNLYVVQRDGSLSRILSRQTILSWRVFVPAAWRE
jgi:glucose/arabinose dehydrogenase